MYKNTYTRRGFLNKSMLASAAIMLGSACSKANARNPTILLVSGWQDVNIGDIAHTPGLIHVLNQFLPEANIILWKRSKGEVVENLLRQNFPALRIIHGNVDENYNVDSQEVIRAFESSDLMIHGSGPSIVGKPNLQAWIKNTNKPFGIFGTTIQEIDSDLKQVLEKASFIFTRETKSLQILNKNNIDVANIDFAPDATFFLDLLNEELAQQFLASKGLHEKQFICVIPRLRYTPYHKIRETNWSDAKIQQVESTNLKYKELDHGKLREAIIHWVRQSGNKVLVCPEMTYQVDIMDELVIDPLPSDVKPLVFKHGYWLPDEAASIYKRAFAVLSFECHSPIISLANSTPAFYLRQPEDTIKGQMYYDLGLSDWIFEIDQTSGSEIADRLLHIWDQPQSAATKIANTHDRVYDIYLDSCKVIKQMLV